MHVDSPSAAPASPEPPSDADDEEHASDAASVDAAADMEPAAASMEEVAPGNILGSATDDALAQMYCNFSTMSRGMLDAIIAATRLGPATAASGAELLARIDGLPGAYFF